MEPGYVWNPTLNPQIDLKNSHPPPMNYLIPISRPSNGMSLLDCFTAFEAFLPRAEDSTAVFFVHGSWELMVRAWEEEVREQVEKYQVLAACT
jgi:hypothetical protein